MAASDSTYQTIVDAAIAALQGIDGTGTYWTDLTAADALVRMGLIPYEDVDTYPSVFMEVGMATSNPDVTRRHEMILPLEVFGVIRVEDSATELAHVHRDALRLAQDIVAALEPALKPPALTTRKARAEEIEIYTLADQSTYGVCRVLVEVRYGRTDGGL